MGHHSRAWAPLVLAAGAGLFACSGVRAKGLATDRLLTMFNGGATDSPPDPALTPDEIAHLRVRLSAKTFLIRGYFSQGQADHGRVSDWLRSPGVRGEVDGQLSVLVKHEDPAGQPAGATRGFRKKLVDEMRPLSDAVCDAKGVGESGRARYDAATLAAGLDLASRSVARMVREGLVDPKQARAGLHLAMDEAASYLELRRWQPSERAPTFGMAIKGGASSGVFSAGVSWRILTLVQNYRQWKSQGNREQFLTKGTSVTESRFAATSGTSAGAVVAATVDIFHQERCQIDPRATELKSVCGMKTDVGHGRECQEYARRLLATLFTCKGQNNLYCVDSRNLWNLADVQKGLMDFKGLRELLARYIKAEALENESEIILTTVDFASGELYTQSDQDPSTIDIFPGPKRLGPQALSEHYRNVEASFVLPFIAWPVGKLRIGGKVRDGVFLDGGIKSEIPVMALAQRGVERAIVIGSGPPRITPSPPQKSAVDIAARYIDESLSAVTEMELNAVVPYARYVESFEQATCRELFDADPGGLPSTQVGAFCRGDLATACGSGTSMGREFRALPIFRTEDVDPTFGYDFDPVQMRRLFNAGAEAVRKDCLGVARFLGMDDVIEVDPAELDRWCNETPVVEQGLCDSKEESARPAQPCDYLPEEAGAKQ